MRRFVVSGCVGLLGLVLVSATPETKVNKGRSGALTAATVSNAPQVVGTIQYDTATSVGALAASGISVGNRFNSALGGPLLMTGNVSMVSIFPARIGGTMFYFTLFGPPNSMGTAANLGSFGVMGAMALAFNVVTLPGTGVAVGPDFLAGFYNQTTPNDGLALDSMATMGQGFHGFQINTNYPTDGTGFTPIASRNAIYRVTGNVLTPVELLDFEIQ